MAILAVRVFLNKKSPRFFKHVRVFFKRVRVFFKHVRVYFKPVRVFFKHMVHVFFKQNVRVLVPPLTKRNDQVQLAIPIENFSTTYINALIFALEMTIW